MSEHLRRRCLFCGYKVRSVWIRSALFVILSSDLRTLFLYFPNLMRGSPSFFAPRWLRSSVLLTTAGVRVAICVKSGSSKQHRQCNQIGMRGKFTEGTGDKSVGQVGETVRERKHPGLATAGSHNSPWAWSHKTRSRDSFWSRERVAVGEGCWQQWLW